MALNVLLVIVTALLTSALTIGAAWYLYQRYVKQMLIDWIDKKAQELGEQVKERVREGVHTGIKDGVSDVSTEVVEKAKEGAAKTTGFGMLEDSLNTWFRAGKNKKPDKGESD